MIKFNWNIVVVNKKTVRHKLNFIMTKTSEIIEEKEKDWRFLEN